MSTETQLRQAVGDALADMTAAWPRAKIDPAGLLDVYVRGLRGVPLAAIRPAVDAMLQRPAVKFAPPPGELRGECLRIANERGLMQDYTPVAMPREGWTAPPEQACPVCGRDAEVRGEWAEAARVYDRTRQRFTSDLVRYAVTYPPACPCWSHVPRRTVYRAPEWLTGGQQWAAQQYLETRVPANDDRLAELTALLRHVGVAGAVERLRPAEGWMTDEKLAAAQATTALVVADATDAYDGPPLTPPEDAI